MVNINSIKSINDAKEAKYNGEKLTQEEKNIFDNLFSSDGKSFIKKIKNKIDSDKINQLEEIHRVSTLLDEVKQAEKAELSDKGAIKIVTDLLNSLKSAQKDDSIAYQVVNSHEKQIDKAIIRLESLSTNDIIQGATVKGKFKAKNFSLSDSEITVQKGDKEGDIMQGARVSGDVELEGDFIIKGATMKIANKPVARTEEEIKLEIIRKEKVLARKNKLFDTYTEKGDAEAMERVEKEMEKLEKEIDNLKLEQQQTQIQVNN